MTAMLPLLSILMLAFSTIVLETCFSGPTGRPADRSHLDDPNVHLEDLVLATVRPKRGFRRV